jgi:hypothetical protein
MELKRIFLILLGIVIVIILIRYLMSDANTLSGLTSAKTLKEIGASELAGSGSSSNYTYSIWIYCDDWNYRYGEAKVIMGRMIDESNACPSISLGSSQNNLMISQTVYDDSTNASDTDPITSNVETFVVNNIPIQKWVNITVTTYGRTMDVYLDGKLVRTNILGGVAKIDPTAPVFITPNGGFSGWTSKFQYWDKSMNPQEVWNVYKKGYGGSWLGGILGTYSVKLSLMEGDTEKSAVVI